MLYEPYKFSIQNVTGLSENLSSKASLSIIAETFSSSESYAVDDYVIYNGVFYKCISAHSGAWDASHFTETLVSDEFGSGGGGGSSDITVIAAEFSSSTSYAVGDYCTYNGHFYRCTTAHTGAWNASHFTQTTVDDELDTKMKKGTDYVTAGLKSGVTIGSQATAEGYNTEPTGSQSHAEGRQTKAGNYAHAEGYQTQASGNASHSEGSGSKATGGTSHAEGDTSTASHNNSHAEGNHTQTGNDNQHVQGKYNVGKSTTAFEIGKGTSNSARSNAFEVEWDGDTTAAGEITDGGGNVLSEKFDATSYVDRYERYTISSSDWSSSTDANGYYTYTLTTSAYNTYKGVEMSCTGADDSTDATSAQKAAFNLINKWWMADGTGVTSATLYAKTKPTTTFYVMLKGNYTGVNAGSGQRAVDVTTESPLNIVMRKAASESIEFNGSTEHSLIFICALVKFTISDWSSTVNADGYYTCSETVIADAKNVHFSEYNIPEVLLIGNTPSVGYPSTEFLPTSAAISSYNLIDYFDATYSNGVTTITAYAKTKPSVSVCVAVQGKSIE